MVFMVENDANLGPGSTGGNGRAQDQGIFFRMSVVAGAAAFGAEAEAPIEADGRGIAGADFEGEMAGVVLGGPGEEGAEEGVAEALTAGLGQDGYGVELAEVLCAVEEERGGCEGEDIFFGGLGA